MGNAALKNETWQISSIHSPVSIAQGIVQQNFKQNLILLLTAPMLEKLAVFSNRICTTLYDTPLTQEVEITDQFGAHFQSLRDLLACFKHDDLFEKEVFDTFEELTNRYFSQVESDNSIELFSSDETGIFADVLKYISTKECDWVELSDNMDSYVSNFCSALGAQEHDKSKI